MLQSQFGQYKIYSSINWLTLFKTSNSYIPFYIQICLHWHTFASLQEFNQKYVRWRSNQSFYSCTLQDLKFWTHKFLIPVLNHEPCHHTQLRATSNVYTIPSPSTTSFWTDMPFFPAGALRVICQKCGALSSCRFWYHWNLSIFIRKSSLSTTYLFKNATKFFDETMCWPLLLQSWPLIIILPHETLRIT